MKKQTVSDIRKQKSKLETFTVKFGGATAGEVGRKTMKKCQNEDLDEAVYKWYVQQRSCGVVVWCCGPFCWNGHFAGTDRCSPLLVR